ncbi:MAG: OmpA family protein, partial [Candidatus Kapaibacterium sp.]
VPLVTSEAGLASWTGTIVQEGKELRRFGGTSTPEPYTWNITGDPMPRLEKPVSVSLEVKDQTGLRKSAATTIEVSQLSIRQKRFEQRDDKRVDRFSLIVFDFNKADLSTENKRILSEVKARIQPNSTVTIAGYADRTGDPEYNKELARKRCAEVEKAISGFSGPTTILPVGSDTLLYDNETPEGRSYCRTVQIVIETPTK